MVLYEKVDTFLSEMCGSRKYPYPPTEGTLVVTPHPPGISVPGGSLATPRPPRNFQYFKTWPPKALGNSKRF